MAMYGYARVSSKDQDPSIQVEALEAAGCEVVRSEKVSGTSTAGRHELKTILSFMRRGDILVVTRIDRLARSMNDLSSIVSGLADKGCFLKVLEQPFDTTRPEGRLMLSMLGAFAEFETDLRKERQAEGIAKAKAEGKYRGGVKGKTAIAREARILELDAQGVHPVDIAEDVKCTRQHVYKIIRKNALPA
ncbi:recombinase family protein [Gluconobacter kondonii]|uniref:recombinase family protein n=1 Tax=Gluconobacter kondonii TaxID=941463 RepID=UPI001B8D08C9|nr:recombinase family protein [Gluconobacter kondonii]MBS1054745.1 recombinase family protein [Gluconobacter kondonii]